MDRITKLALAGLVGGALTLVGCPSDKTAKTAAKTGKTDGKTTKTGAADKYSDLHECSGKNTCKGLGGCKVDADKLKKLAKAAGVDEAKAGSAHDCGGKNACKGLGGCSVDATKLAKYKAAKTAK